MPGNHDVNRGVDSADASIRRLIKSLRSGEEKLDSVLASSERVLLARRMEAYLALAKDFAPFLRARARGSR